MVNLEEELILARIVRNKIKKLQFRKQISIPLTLL